MLLKPLFLPTQSSLPVKKQIFSQPLGTDDLEDDLIGLQGLAVDTAGQRWVKALSQTLANGEFLGHNLVLGIVLQYLWIKF